MFFVVNPGRSGSRTVAQVLSQSPNCTCMHEPYPQLIAESTRARYGEQSFESVAEVLGNTRSSVVDGKVYGECANKLSYVLPAVRLAFPEAQVVWLVRDGRDFVASALQRGWYSQQENDRPVSDWQRWRIQGDRAGAMSQREWGSLDAFAKTCWLWTWTNELIGSDIGDADHLLVRIEELGRLLPRLCSWLAIEPTDFMLTRANRRRTAADLQGADPRKSYNVDRIATFQDWNSQQRAVFERWCAHPMDELYPGWRDDNGAWRETPLEVSRRSVATRIGSQPGEETASAPSPPAQDRIAGVERMLMSLRSEVAELRLLRQEHGTLLAQFKQAQHILDQERRRREEADQAARQAKAALHRVETSLQEHIGAREQLERALREERERYRSLRHSTPYRLGERLSAIAAAPYRGLRSTYGALLRALPPEQGLALRRVVARIRGSQLPGSVPGAGSMAGQDRVMEVPPGGQVAHTDDSGTSTVVLVLWDVSPEEAEQAAADIAAMQAQGQPLRPLFVTDCDAFHVFRRAGYLFEYVPPRRDWTARFSEDYDRFLDERMQEIVDVYRPDRLVVLDGSRRVRDLPAGLLVALLPRRGKASSWA
ncbi:MAG: hypothetical protein M3276_05300 [Actinomycetota bacterium]|nr:hypothetical protein [Actinomycetota bacterium]